MIIKLILNYLFWILIHKESYQKHRMTLKFINIENKIMLLELLDAIRIKLTLIRFIFYFLFYLK